ncbi:MAG: hypothetical protein R6U98_17790 [Pirellulaceae bacterium]
MFRKTLFVPLLLLLAVVARGQEIDLTPAQDSIQPGYFVMVSVDGLTQAELADANFSVEWTPSENVVVFRTWDSTGKPALVFVTNPNAAGGEYTITVAVNGRYLPASRALDEAVSESQAAGVDADLLADMRDVQERFGARYPVRSGSCTVTVEGDGPGPDPPPPPTDVESVLILEETTDRTPAVGDIVTSQRLRDELAEKGIEFRVLDKDVMDQDGSQVPAVQSVLSELGDLRLPVLALFDGSGAVVSIEPLPADVDTILERIE